MPKHKIDDKPTTKPVADLQHEGESKLFNFDILGLPNGVFLVTASRWQDGVAHPHTPEGVLISSHGSYSEALAAISKAEGH